MVAARPSSNTNTTGVPVPITCLLYTSYLALLLACHHPIHIPLGGMYSLAQLGQDAAQAVGGHAPHDRRVGRLHPLESLGGGKGQHLLRMVLLGGKAETEAEEVYKRQQL